MLSNRIGSCVYQIVPQEAGVPLWNQETVQSVEDMETVIQTISQGMARAGFPEKEVLRVGVALGEAIVNACKHGNQGDWAKSVSVRHHVHEESMVVQVEDQGRGFDPEDVPDPCAPENLERPSGRGLFMMRAFLSGVCHNEPGNCVCLCKHHPK